MIPESTIVSYTYTEMEERCGLYVTLLHSIGLFLIVLCTLEKCVCISIDFARELYQSEVKHTASNLVGSTAVSKKVLILFLDNGKKLL